MIQICDHKLLIFLLLIMSVLACETTEILTFTGYEGGKVEIRCPYESGYEEQNKYICRGECPVLSKDIPFESGSPAKDRRFSLTDDRTTHIFTVTITDLRTEDQGKYWCSVRTGLGKSDVYTEINLEIKPVTSAMTSSKPTTTASVYTSKPATEDPVTSVFPLSSSTTSPSVLLNSSSSYNTAAPQTKSGFTVFIMLVVIGILTGCGFSLFMYFRWRQTKEGKQPRDIVQGPTEHLPNRDMKPNREATHADSDYDEIGNTLDHPDYSLVFPVFDEHDTSVYALAQLPSSPSDNLNYSTVKFTATRLSDRTDGQDTSDYATVRP